MPPNAAPPTAALERSVPLMARRDIAVRSIHYQGEPYWVIKDPLNLGYFRLQPEQYEILQLLDGRRSLEEIRAEFTRRFPTRRPTLAQIQSLIVDLYEKELVWSTRPGQGESLARRGRRRQRKRWLGAVRNVLFIRLPGWDPERLIERGYPAARWIFHPAALAAAVLIVLWSWGLLTIRFDQFEQRLPSLHELLNWQTLVIFWLTIGAAKLLHELGHALACRHFGGECHEIGLAFLIFSPCLYCDVSDSWMLPSKWKRIAVAAAGMYVELVISAVALLLWWNTREGLLNQILLNVFLVTNVTTIVFNLNPLLRLDGYYILSDWLEIPNLRSKSDRSFQQTFARWCLGIRTASNPFLPQHGRFWFVAYAIASAMYRWFLVFVVCIILYQTLKPYHLETFGLALGGLSVVVAVASVIHRVANLVSANRDQIAVSRRPAISLAVAAGLLAIGLLVPLPLHVDAPMVVEPYGIRHVYASTPGRVVTVSARPGERVERGRTLVQLSNGPKHDRYEQLKTALEVQQAEIRVQQSLGDADQEALANETLRAIGSEVDHYRRQLERLRIVAPCDGRVIAAATVPEKPAQSIRHSLPQWHGTPTDLENNGCFLAAGTHVLSIAPDERFQAVLLIDQSDRHDFGESTRVKIKTDHLPGHTFRGSIENISTGTLDLTDAQVASGVSQNLRAVAALGSEDSTNRRFYQATVLIDADEGMLLPGMPGQARILVARRTAAAWLWRYFRKTFNFDL